MKKRLNVFNNDDSFDRKFNSIFALSRGIIGISFVLTLILIVAAFYFGFHVINNPESVGQFFGKIVNGFNSAK